MSERQLSVLERTDRYAVVAARSVWREVFLRNPLIRRKLILVNEFPKSGGTWLCRMLRDLTGREFADNRLPFSTNGIVKQHSIADYNIASRVIVWRDPRDVMVSLYFHCFFVHEDYAFNKVMVQRSRARYQFEDYDDVKANLPVFVRDQFTNPLTPFTWPQFAGKWTNDSKAVGVRYEDLRSDTVSTLRNLVSELNISPVRTPEDVADSHDISKRKTSDQNGKSFVRRGKVAGFVDYLDAETISFIESECGPQMKQLGYKFEGSKK
ncbi:MAG: sulfotransferase domain-containing protein [Planctomycetaceae bacterium]